MLERTRVAPQSPGTGAAAAEPNVPKPQPIIPPAAWVENTAVAAQRIVLALGMAVGGDEKLAPRAGPALAEAPWRGPSPDYSSQEVSRPATQLQRKRIICVGRKGGCARFRQDLARLSGDAIGDKVGTGLGIQEQREYNSNERAGNQDVLGFRALQRKIDVDASQAVHGIIRLRAW